MKRIELPIRLSDVAHPFDLLMGRPTVSRFRKFWTKETLENMGKDALKAGASEIRSVTKVANSYNKGYSPGDSAEVTMQFTGGEWWITSVSREQRRRTSYGLGRNWVCLKMEDDPLLKAVFKEIAENP